MGTILNHIFLHFISFFYGHFYLKIPKFPVSTTSHDQSHDVDHDSDIIQKVLVMPSRINTKSKCVTVVNSWLSCVVSTKHLLHSRNSCVMPVDDASIVGLVIK